MNGSGWTIIVTMTIDVDRRWGGGGGDPYTKQIISEGASVSVGDDHQECRALAWHCVEPPSGCVERSPTRRAPRRYRATPIHDEQQWREDHHRDSCGCGCGC